MSSLDLMLAHTHLNLRCQFMALGVFFPRFASHYNSKYQYTDGIRKEPCDYMNSPPKALFSLESKCYDTKQFIALFIYLFIYLLLLLLLLFFMTRGPFILPTSIVYLHVKMLNDTGNHNCLLKLEGSGFLVLLHNRFLHLTINKPH